MVSQRIAFQNVPPGKPASGSIAHGAAILVCLSRRITTVSEIARQTGLGKSTVHRVLKLLEDADLVMQDPVNRNYYLGPLVARLNADPRTSHEHLVILALQEMQRLSRVSEETVTLDILVGRQLISLFEMPSRHDLKVTADRSAGDALHAGASRKVLLGQLPEKQLQAVVSTIHFDAVTDRTVTSRDVLLAQIKDVRAQGYAVSYGEWNTGVVCLSVPVQPYLFPVAISIIGPEIRLQPNLRTLIEEARLSAGRVAVKLRDYLAKA
jgi:DNA-binding IclR family transcriptional regulator